MLRYYKTKTEIARNLGVTETTVRKWLKKAIDKTLNLEIEEVEGEFYILKSGHNQDLMQTLVEKNRKHRPQSLKTTVVAKDELYEILTKKDIISLLNTIEIHRTIPTKYSYFGKGAELWDVQSRHKEYNGENGFSYFEETFRKYTLGYFENKKINIIDIGQGNSLPLIPLLKNLIQTDQLNKYIAIDISAEMLHISNKNLDAHNIPDKYRFQYQLDYENESLQSILFEAREGNEVDSANLIMMLDTNVNTTDIPVKVLQHIRDGMFPDDYLCISAGHDSPEYRTISTVVTDTINRRLYIPSLLGLTSEDYELEQKYNDQLQRKENNLIMRKDITIKVERLNRSIELLKGQRLNIWMYHPETFKFISEKAEQSRLVLHLIARNPNNHRVFYMLGIK